MCGQHSAGAHAVEAGTYVLPALTCENIHDTLVPHWLRISHVTHVACESTGIALLDPQIKLFSVIE
jgi:hypothetical protein